MFAFKVMPDNGEPFVVEAGTRDVLTWEKTTKGKTYAGLLQEPNLVDYYKIAHLACWRQGLFSGSLKDFEDQHDIDLSYEVEVEEPDPTQSGPFNGPSSPSPSTQESAPAPGQKKAHKQS